jgi:hypothetical protein
MSEVRTYTSPTEGAAPQARLDQHCSFILPTNAVDAIPLPPQKLLAGSKGRIQAERRCCFVTEPECLTPAFDLKTPERSMVFVMVMTIWWGDDASYHVMHCCQLSDVGGNTYSTGLRCSRVPLILRAVKPCRSRRCFRNIPTRPSCCSNVSEVCTRTVRSTGLCRRRSFRLTFP